MRNIIKHNDKNFNERMNTLLYKNIISLTLFLKGWCWLCVRDELETGTDLFWPKVLLTTIAALLPHLAGVAQLWVTEGRKTLSLQADSRVGILSPTDSNRLYPDYIIVSCPPASAVLPLIYTGTSLDWRLSWGSIYNTTALALFCNMLKNYQDFDKKVLWIGSDLFSHLDVISLLYELFCCTFANLKMHQLSD